MSPAELSLSSITRVDETKLPRNSRFIENLDEVPLVDSPNTSMKLVWQVKAQPHEMHLSPATSKTPEMPSWLSHVFRDPITSPPQKSPVEDFLAPGDPLAPFLDEPEYPIDTSPNQSCTAPRHLYRSNALHRARRPRTPHPSARRPMNSVEPSVFLVTSTPLSQTQADCYDDFDSGIEPLCLGPPLVPVPILSRSGSLVIEPCFHQEERQKHMTEFEGTCEQSHKTPFLAAEPQPAGKPSRGLLARLAIKFANIFHVC